MFFSTNLWGFSNRISIWEEVQREGNFILYQNTGKPTQSGSKHNSHMANNQLYLTCWWRKSFRKHKRCRHLDNIFTSFNTITLYHKKIQIIVTENKIHKININIILLLILLIQGLANQVKTKSFAHCNIRGVKSCFLKNTKCQTIYFNC